MADDVNFVNGHLRLKCFLRLNQNPPPSPARCTRRLPKNPQVTEKLQPGAEALLGPGLLQSDAASAGTWLDYHVTRSAFFKPGTSKIHPELTPNSALQQPSAIKERLPVPGNQTIEGGSSGSIAHLDDPDEDTPRTQSTAQHVPWSHPQELLASGAEHRRMGDTLRKLPHTRKRRLPVNELALMRTTTEYGLPDRRVTEDESASPIAQTDPIEDSHSCNNLPTMPQRPSRITKARSKLLRPFQQIQSIRKTVRYHKPSASSQGYHRVLRSVADGFELSELARYPATKPPTRALRKPKNGKNDTGPSPLVMVTTSTLPKPIIDDHCQLVNPYSRIMDSSTHSGQALSIVRLGKDTPTAARQPDMVLARVRQEKNCQKSTGYNERRPTNKRVLHQLAAVTAPQRHDSDSDSSSGEDHESDFSDEDNADTRLSPSPGFEQEEQDIWASQPVVNFLELRTRQALTQRWMVAHEV